MKFSLGNSVRAMMQVRNSSVELVDAWRIGQAEFSKLNYRKANKDGYKKNALIYACIREIATSVADAEFQVTRENTDDVIQHVKDHPAQLMLDNPNPVMTTTEWWEALLTIEHIAGDAFVLKDMEMRALWILRPDLMKIIQMPNGGRQYKYGHAGQEVILQEDEVIHFPYGVNPLDIYAFGQSPLEAIWHDTEIDNSATDFFKAFFDNAAVPSGIITVKRRLARQSEATRIRKRWQERYSGAGGWHAPAVLDEDASYQKIGLTLEELRMDTLRHVTESRICMGFGVPPIIVGANVGLQRSTYSNYREARATFWEETLAPMYKRHAQIIQKHLISEFPLAPRFGARFDLSKVVALQQQRIAMAVGFTPALTAGGLTVNQFLSLIGLNPVADGDRYVAGLTSDESNEDGDDNSQDNADRAQRAAEVGDYTYHEAILEKLGVLELVK